MADTHYYHGYAQQGDYSSLTVEEIRQDFLAGYNWVDYYWTEAPKPHQGEQAMVEWKRGNAELRDKLREAGIYV